MTTSFTAGWLDMLGISCPQIEDKIDQAKQDFMEHYGLARKELTPVQMKLCDSSHSPKMLYEAIQAYAPECFEYATRSNNPKLFMFDLKEYLASKMLLEVSDKMIADLFALWLMDS